MEWADRFLMSNSRSSIEPIQLRKGDEGLPVLSLDDAGSFFPMSTYSRRAGAPNKAVFTTCSNIHRRCEVSGEPFTELV